MADHFTNKQLYDALSTLALKAGAAVMDIYESDFTAETKSDASPVTEADRLAEEIIVAGLSDLAPGTPVLAEESAAAGRIPDQLGDQFFLVDPLDGTREFVNRTGEFTINIALIENSVPVYGVIYAPAMKRLYAGGGGVASKTIIGSDDAPGSQSRIHARAAQANGLVAVASRSHRSPETDAYLETLSVADFTAAGSSLKFCLIAEGRADIYPRFGRTMEWDTGAGQAILEAAGGSVVVHPGGEQLTYGKRSRGFDNPHFIARGAF